MDQRDLNHGTLEVISILSVGFSMNNLYHYLMNEMATSKQCSKNCQECPVWQKSLFKDFDPELLSWLQERKSDRMIIRGETFFNQGSQVDGLYCHSAGLSKVVQKDNNDKIRFARLVFPGDTSGHRSLFIQNHYQGTTIALSETANACFIPIDDVLFLLSKSPSFAQNLIVKISMELRRSEEDKMATKERTVRGRLAELLLKIAHEYSEETDKGEYLVKSEITKREIAKILLVADETIIRLMSEMAKDGVIDYVNKHLLIKDIKSISDLSKY